MLTLTSNVRVVDDESGTFLLDTTRGVYWHLNPVAMTIVSHLSSGSPVVDVVQRVVAEFDVDTATARKDVEHLVRDLRRARLLEQRR